MTDRPQLSRPGLANLAVVYVVWGSTYLAIRVAVREDAGFPPFAMAFMRVMLASALLLTWARLRRERLRLTRDETILMFGSGTLLWLGGNGLVNLSERHIASGLAAPCSGPWDRSGCRDASPTSRCAPSRAISSSWAADPC